MIHTVRATFQNLENQWEISPASRRPLIALAAIVAVIALPLLLCIDLGRFIYRPWWKNTPSVECHHFYSSPIFSIYDKQLKNFVEEECKTSPSLRDLPLVKMILDPSVNPRETYQTTLLELRKQIKNKAQSSEEVAQFIEKLSDWIFTKADLFPVTTAWVHEQLTQEERNRLSNPSTLAQTLQEIHSRWSTLPHFQGRISPDYHPYDPRLEGDAPSQLFRIGDTQIIRTPAVTCDEKRSLLGNLRKAKIVEEFSAFLDSCEKSKRHHLYINLMHRSGSEAARTEALESLEKERSKVLSFLTLSKDCDFYHQTGTYPEKSDAFKKEFIHQILTDTHSFHRPISWKKEEFEQLCTDALNKVHQSRFNNVEKLDRQQRKNFIELAYTEIIQDAIQHYKPYSCNVSCRSCVDRGAANLSLLYARTQPLIPKTLLTIALAPAVLTQNRVMLSHRLTRLCQALPLILANPG